MNITKGQTWTKRTEQWCGDDPKGTPVKVVKYEKGWIWYKRSFFGDKYCLNEFSFRRIYEYNKG